MTLSTLVLMSLASVLALLKLALMVFVVLFAAGLLIKSQKKIWNRAALSWVTFRSLPHA